MIIFGTGNYFKSNRQQVDGSCEACDFVGRLSQYDTIRFLHVYWIPVIPLGRQHVLAECPKCHSGRAMPLGKWRVAQQELTDIYHAFEQNPTVQARAMDAVGAAVGTYDQARFLELALQVEERFATDPQVLGQLAWAYDFFTMEEEAEGACLESLRLKDDHAVRSMLAHLLIRQGRLNEASDHVQTLLATQDASYAGVPLVMAEALGMADRPVEGLALLDQAIALWPQIGDDKPIRKLHKQLSKAAQHHAPSTV